MFKLSHKTLMKLLRFWPPYWASGISVINYNNEFNEITVQLVQRRTNTNVVVTHFGGSLYSMCDQFFMFILLEHLGKDQKLAHNSVVSN